MNAAAREPESIEPTVDRADAAAVPAMAELAIADLAGTEYATRGARGLRAARPHLRMVSPLRPERASRGVFALVVTGLLLVGMVLILVINTSLAQGAFTVSELQAARATLVQQEQKLSEAVAAAAVPESLERAARSMGMVPSETPVFLSLPTGKVLGKPKAAGGATTSFPRLLTPADATATEAVDAVGTDGPLAPGPDYDPAAADAAELQAAAANAEALEAEVEGSGDAAKGNKKPKDPTAENSLWGDSTIIDVTAQLSSQDSGLVAVPVD